MKSDKITELYFSDVNQPIVYDRREFIKKLGSGIIIVFSLGKLSLLQGWSQNDDDDALIDFNAYLRVKEDGRVACYTGKIEMGQGVITSLAQALAEELEIPISSVDMIMGDTDLCPYDAGTWGSLTTRFADPVLRAAAAEAREILIDLAAEKFKVSDQELEAANGTVFLKSDQSKVVTYASLTKGKKIVQSLKKKPEIKKSKDFDIIGKPVISLDATAKVTGAAKYSGDIKLPGMVYARIVRPPTLGSKNLQVDASGLSEFDGVELVEKGNLVAVVHTDPEVANKAVKSVEVKWQEPKFTPDNESIFQYFDDNIKDSKVNEESGSLEAGKEASKTINTANYYDGYKAHAPIETHTATCYFKDDKLIMWASTQTPFGTREELAKTFDMPLEKVYMKQIFLGGGFGGKIYNRQAIEAAIISKSCDKPVQLAWNRREEFMYDMFRPAALMKISSGIDEDGKLSLWKFDIYCAGSRGTKLFYDIPDNRTRIFSDRNIHPLGTGAWRAPGNNSTTFARESHIDVMAHAAGIDPLKFRLDNLKDQDMSATLKLAAKTFNWGRKKTKGHGYGIALGADAGTLVAMIAEVHVDTKTGTVKPIRVVCAQDMGQVVNPHGAILQTEGGITMGLGYALYEDVEFTGSKVKSRNFKNYKFTRFSNTPKIDCVFVDKMDAEPQGGGEPAIICMGGAIANAVFDACGARVNRIPITPERILKALQEK